MNLSKIAVIVAARDAQATIRKCLDSLLALDYPVYEVIVVDDGSKDNTPGILEEYKDKIKVITLRGNGPSAARNAASRQTQAEYLAFTDSDCIADRQWLKELLKGFSGQEAAACGGRQDVPADESEFGKDVFSFMRGSRFFTDYSRRSQGGVIEVRHNPSYNVMYRKDIFLREGGFLEGLWPGEDVELDYRLKIKGYKMIWNPDAIVYHYKPRDMVSFKKMMSRYGWAQGFLVRRYGFFRRIHLVPFISLSGFILWLAAGWNGSLIVLPAGTILALVFLLALSGFNLRTLRFLVLALLYWHLGFFRALAGFKR